MTKRVLSFFLIITVSGLTTKVTAQGKTPEKYWLSVGAGSGKLANLTVALAYELRNKPTLLTARYAYNMEIFTDQDVSPLNTVNDAGLLYGYKAGKFRFSAGLSYVFGTSRGKFLQQVEDPLMYGEFKHERRLYKTVGIPAEIRFLTSTRDLGIGVTAYGNLNRERSHVGLNLSFYLGNFR